MPGPRKTDGPPKPRAAGTRRTAAKKPAPAVKLVEPAPKPEITVVTPAEPVVSEKMVKKNDLIDRVVEASGLKRKDVKPALEAMFAEMDKIIGEGATLQIPELGKLMIHKRKPVANGEMVMLKLRRKTAAKPLAEDGDNG
ncbi:HU family DNA-binding protein [Vannielia litorea]|uniref:Nucleoid DNA-binding protein n=1 Tax=Vannielia litorea TaxID=1217970 RepID=A0A1N6FKG3_9RHOB|nr:HU family DNA-binding protein [Vannielia litorea]SIN95745.1 nucleoid DNA-binding protein [Vannielia litorea]